MRLTDPEGVFVRVMLEAESEHVRPELDAALCKFTVPVNPFIPETVIVTIPLAPALIVRLGVFVETAKSVTVSTKIARWTVVPLVAFTTTL